MVELLAVDTIAKVIGIIIAVVILDRIIERGHDKLVQKALIGKLIFHRLGRTLLYLAGLTAILWTIDIMPLWNQFQVAYPNLSRFVAVAILWGAVFLIVRNFTGIFEEVRDKVRIRAMTKEVNVLVQKWVSYVIYAGALLFTMNIFGLIGAIQGLLVGAGFAGIVLGFAAQETIGNILAGFVLMLDRPFKIGDWIHLKNSNLVGEVIEISLRSTTINAPDNTPINLPNSLVAREPLVNYSAHRLYRYFIPIGISYESDVPKAIKVITKTLESDEAAAKEGVKNQGYFAPIEVLVEKFGDSSVDMKAKVFVDTTKGGGKFKTKSRMVSNIKKNLEKAGVEIPYPRRYVIFDKDQKRKKR